MSKNNICVVQVSNISYQFAGRSISHLIDDKSVLGYLLERIKNVPLFSKVIVATTIEKDDDSIERLSTSIDVECFRGNRQDVLGRIYSAVVQYKPDDVIQLFGNAPLVDLDELEALLEEHHAGGYDYSYNDHVKGVIYGMGCSILSFDLLSQLVVNSKISIYQRELGSIYIRQHPEGYKILVKDAQRSWPTYRVLVDYPKDIELVRSIVQYAPMINNVAVGTFISDNPLLTEYQRHEVTSETGIEKLFLFPDKVKHYLEKNADFSYPILVEMSLTNACNFNCVWCSDKELRNKLGGEISIDTFRKLLDDLVVHGGTKGIVIEGGGEPTIHKRFDEIVEMTTARGFSIGLITNGSVPIDVNLIPKFSWIRISLDAATPQQHKKYKRTDMYNTVMENIRIIGAHKGDCTLGIGYVVTRHNTANLENLVLLLREYNVDYIQFRPVIDNPEYSSNIDLTYLRKYATNSFVIDVAAMDANRVSGNAGLPCKAHSLSTVITADGGVYLCGRLNIYDWCKQIGNINDTSFRSIWLGEERAKQIREVMDPDFCNRHCPQCRMTKYNQLLNKAANIKTKNFI